MILTKTSIAIILSCCLSHLAALPSDIPVPTRPTNYIVSLKPAHPIAQSLHQLAYQNGPSSTSNSNSNSLGSLISNSPTPLTSSLIASAPGFSESVKSFFTNLNSTVNMLSVGSSFRGMLLTLNPESMKQFQDVSELAESVDFFEENVRVQLSPIPSNDTKAEGGVSGKQQNQPQLDTQSSPKSWGLDRIDQRNLPLDNEYLYPKEAGEGVNVYIIDTGIRLDHVEYKGRAVWGATVMPNQPDEDNNGHGTFVAGVVGGQNFGVAKKVRMIAVKALDQSGSGTLSDLVRGIEYVVSQHRQGDKSIANLSLGAKYSRTLNSAVNSAVNQGITFISAAGNDGDSACSYSPASAGSSITAGATTKTDTLATFSNRGRCVDILAPGKDIISSWYTSSTADNVLSGTSFSAPYVAGAAALILSTNPSPLSPQQVRDRIIQSSTDNTIDLPFLSTTPNKMLYSIGGIGGSQPSAAVGRGEEWFGLAVGLVLGMVVFGGLF
ncbi:peptidase S8/S53 domain-containing protein [Paraphysoderma sedebokerense]|nr:peptidase S8/S53 domain-containing protein [Paraphysoderma sedebokerense]KAI9140775.1 peptidase S8/S53 domain-containing protein [Paraphysoderma sedebokerense]